MGFLDLFSKARPTVQLLPSGSMTVDRSGEILASTVASSFSEGLLRKVALRVLVLFKTAAAAQMPLSNVTLNYASLQIRARELRGGAMIFFTPKHSFNISSQTEQS
jgi:hypothetical protein